VALSHKTTWRHAYKLPPPRAKHAGADRKSVSSSESTPASICAGWNAGANPELLTQSTLALARASTSEQQHASCPGHGSAPALSVTVMQQTSSSIDWCLTFSRRSDETQTRHSDEVQQVDTCSLPAHAEIFQAAAQLVKQVTDGSLWHERCFLMRILIEKAALMPETTISHLLLMVASDHQ